jgi:hypothetical protein
MGELTAAAGPLGDSASVHPASQLTPTPDRGETAELLGQEADLTSGDYRLEIVRRLLTQDICQSEFAVLNYPIHLAWHVGAIAVGPRAPELLRNIESKLGLALLLVPWGDVTWAWLGSRRGSVDAEQIRRAARGPGTRALLVAIGSPHRGLHGFRQTHREAQLALLLGLRQETKVTQYADSPLVAAALEDPTLAAWLRAFVRPLLERRDGVVDLLPALRAYIDAGLNLRAAGAQLGRDRHTIARRVGTAEAVLKRAVRDCVAELDTALRFYQLEVSHGQCANEQLVGCGADQARRNG